MDIEEYKKKRNEKIKFLFRSGATIKEIKKTFCIDENLIKKICQNEKRIEVKGWRRHFQVWEI